MLVLGVDPGLTRCGVGVVAGSPGRARLVEAGVIRASTQLSVERRLLAVEEGLEQWLARHRPDAVAVERVFAQHNVMTVIGTAQAAGVAMLVAARHQIPVAQHTPSEVATMVARILRLAQAPRPADAADAVALAICHLWRGGQVNRLAAAVGAQPRSWSALAAARGAR